MSKEEFPFNQALEQEKKIDRIFQERETIRDLWNKTKDPKKRAALRKKWHRRDQRLEREYEKAAKIYGKHSRIYT